MYFKSPSIARMCAGCLIAYLGFHRSKKQPPGIPKQMTNTMTDA